MNILEDIKLYLPKYLSSESEKTLFEELSSFPENIDSRLYTSSLNNVDIVFQGDGFQGLLFINFPDTKIGNVPAMILSNTCDINPQNQRIFQPNIVYSPIFNLEKYRNGLLEEGFDQQRIEDHMASLKRQENTSIFYLPRGGSLEADSLVFFDRINSCPIDYLDQRENGKQKLFILSGYGHYLFLFKLSIHFTRVREGVDRDKGIFKQ